MPINITLYNENSKIMFIKNHALCVVFINLRALHDVNFLSEQGKNSRPIYLEQIGTALLARRVEGRMPVIKSAVYIV